MVETVDIITPIVDDPYTFGAICAANSVSDVFAMGGTPLTALAILGFATCDFGAPVIKRLLKGAIDKLHEAGACLIGGHSIEDNEFKFGFAVSGVVDKKNLLRAAGAKLP
jgi:selenide,water dikinase